MRVAVDIIPGLGTGMGRWQRESVRALAAHPATESEVSVFAFRRREPRPEWLPGGVGYRRCRIPGRAQALLTDRLGLPVERVCGLGRPDVVLGLNLHPLRTNVPVVQGVADMSWRHFDGQYRAWFTDQQIRLAEDAIRRADHILTLSRYSADDLIRGGTPANRVTVAYLGVGDEFRSVTPADANRVRTAHQLPDEFVLYVGAINERKNLGVLAAALRQLDPVPPLIIAGPPPLEPLAFWHLDGLGVRHLGYVPETDLPGLFRAATVKVFPSKLEGFGLPLVEAMAAGTPVLASDIPVFREIGGDAVTFFPPDDPATLAAHLRTAFGSSQFRAEARGRGLNQAREWTWDRYADDLVAALQAARRTHVGPDRAMPTNLHR